MTVEVTQEMIDGMRRALNVECMDAALESESMPVGGIFVGRSKMLALLEKAETALAARAEQEQRDTCEACNGYRGRIVRSAHNPDTWEPCKVCREDDFREWLKKQEEDECATCHGTGQIGGGLTEYHRLSFELCSDCQPQAQGELMSLEEIDHWEKRAREKLSEFSGSQKFAKVGWPTVLGLCQTARAAHLIPELKTAINMFMDAHEHSGAESHDGSPDVRKRYDLAASNAKAVMAECENTYTALLVEIDRLTAELERDKEILHGEIDRQHIALKHAEFQINRLAALVLDMSPSINSIRNFLKSVDS